MGDSGKARTENVSLERREAHPGAQLLDGRDLSGEEVLDGTCEGQRLALVVGHVLEPLFLRGFVEKDASAITPGMP